MIENAIKDCNELISFVPEKIETQIKKPNQNLILSIKSKSKGLKTSKCTGIQLSNMITLII